MKVCESVNIFKQTLTEAILLLCKSELRFNQEFCIDGLLGITLDQNEVILIKINENLVASGSQPGTALLNESNNKELIDRSYHTEIPKITSNRLRIKKGVNHVEMSELPSSPLNYVTKDASSSKSEIYVKNEQEFSYYDPNNTNDNISLNENDDLSNNVLTQNHDSIEDERITFNNMNNSLNEESTSQVYIKREACSPSFEITKRDRRFEDVRNFKSSKYLSAIKDNSRNLHDPCSNCGTRATTMWRISSAGLLMCNACGLYLKLHGINRPLSYVRDNIQVRRRRRMDSKDHLVHYANEITSELINLSKHHNSLTAPPDSSLWPGVDNFWAHPGFWTGVGNVLNTGGGGGGPDKGGCSRTDGRADGEAEETT